jgi:hypothetical protein
VEKIKMVGFRDEEKGCRALKKEGVGWGIVPTGQNSRPELVIKTFTTFMCPGFWGKSKYQFLVYQFERHLCIMLLQSRTVVWSVSNPSREWLSKTREPVHAKTSTTKQITCPITAQQTHRQKGNNPAFSVPVHRLGELIGGFRNLAPLWNGNVAVAVCSLGRGNNGGGWEKQEEHKGK